MRYCECPFPIFREAIDVANRTRMKCERCKCYEDPQEAAENGRPIDDSCIVTGHLEQPRDPLYGGSHWQRGVGNYGG